MTTAAREMTRSERTFQSLHEVDTQRLHSAWESSRIFAICGGYNRIIRICEASLQGYRYWATTRTGALVISSQRSPHWTCLQISDQMEPPAEPSGDAECN